MNIPIVSITSSSASKESPITSEYLIELLNNDINKLARTNELIEFLLEKLQKKSSKHKFLIQATRLKSPSEINADLNILTSFGAVWDSNRDGYISIKVELKGDKDKEPEKNGDSTEIPIEQTAEEEIENSLKSEGNENEKIEGSTLENGTNGNTNGEETKEELINDTDIKSDGDDSLKVDKSSDESLSEPLEKADVEDSTVKTDLNENVEIENNQDLEEDLGTTKIEDDSTQAVDIEGPHNKGQLVDDSTTESKEKGSLTSKEEADSSTDTILVSVYWIFVD